MQGDSGMKESSGERASDSIWVRLLYMLVLALIFSIVETVVYVTAVVALVSVLLSGSVNEPVRRFGKSLGRYANQVIDYLTFNAELRPFPFSAWPDGGRAVEARPSSDSLASTGTGVDDPGGVEATRTPATRVDVDDRSSAAVSPGKQTDSVD